MTDKLINTGTVHTQINANTVQMAQNQEGKTPLTDMQWRQVKERISVLDSKGIPSQEAYTHLICHFGVQKTREISTDRYTELMEQLDVLFDKQLEKDRVRQRTRAILTLPENFKALAEEYVKYEFGRNLLFMDLSASQLDQVLEFIKQEELKMQRAASVKTPVNPLHLFAMKILGKK